VKKQNLDGEKSVEVLAMMVSVPGLCSGDPPCSQPPYHPLSGQPDHRCIESSLLGRRGIGGLGASPGNRSDLHPAGCGASAIRDTCPARLDGADGRFSPAHRYCLRWADVERASPLKVIAETSLSRPSKPG
jgi:hypothetical protein